MLVMTNEFYVFRHEEAARDRVPAQQEATDPPGHSAREDGAQNRRYQNSWTNAVVLRFT